MRMHSECGTVSSDQRTHAQTAGRIEHACCKALFKNDDCLLTLFTMVVRGQGCTELVDFDTRVVTRSFA